MQLTKLSINRPLTMLMIILAIAVLGWQAYNRLQVDRMPKADIPFVTVVVGYPGASPEDVSAQVLEKIEDAVAGISGIKKITSKAGENFGSVMIEFNEGIDGNQAAVDVSRQVDSVKGNLPDDATEPTIIKADFNAVPIMQILLTGPQGQDALYNLADSDLKPRLQAVEGVASIDVAGGREQQVFIEADPIKLAAYGLPLEKVQQALLTENANIPAGSIDTGNQKNSIRSIGKFADVAEIETILVSGNPIMQPGGGKDAGGPVYMRDVATVALGYDDASRLVRYNGQEAVLIKVTKTSDANAIEVSDLVHEELDIFAAELPPGVSLDVVVDDADFTRESVAAVQEDLMLAVIICGLIILVFLHSPVSSFIVMLSVPTSLLATFLAMWMFDFSLNTLTLIALTLVIGILVDDSIVVLENAERHLKMGKNLRQATLDGRAEIGLATITITLVVVVVYLPVAFVSGVVGQFFFQYGITISVATLFSLLVSYTLTPMLSALWLKDESADASPPTGLIKFFYVLFKPVVWLWNKFIWLWELGFTWLANLYALTLRIALKNVFTQLLVVVISVAALIGGLYLVASGVISSEFIPQEDDGQLKVQIEMPAGTNLESTDRVARHVEQIVLANVPETAKIVTDVGSNGSGGFSAVLGGGGGNANYASLTVILVDKQDRARSTSQVVEALRPLLNNNVPTAKFAVALNSSMGGSNDIEIKLLGPDNDTLIDLAAEAETIIAAVPGAADIRNSGADRSPETQVVINRQRARDMKLSPVQVGGTLRAAINGSDAGTLDADGADEIDIVLRMNESARKDLNQLLKLPVGYVEGQPIALGQVATVEDALAPGSVERLNRQPAMTIKTGYTGRGSGDVTDDIEAALNAQMDFPPGYTFRFGGESEMQRDAFSELTSALLLSILLIYMLLVALYQSWMQPLAIMFTLPVALVGAFGGLWLTGSSINIMSLLGIIMLVGLVTKNAVLLVDFTNQLRYEQGYGVKEALVEAGRLRLRPILMTVLTLVLALLPLMMGAGAGAEMRQPIAAVIVGGMTSSTLLTFILIPVVYNFFEWTSSLTSRVVRKVLGLQKSTENAQKQDVAPVPSPGA